MVSIVHCSTSPSQIHPKTQKRGTNYTYTYMLTTSRSNRRMQLAFGSAILALLFVGTLSYRAVVVFNDSDLWVRHTNEVLKTLQGLLLSVKSIESDARAFALTQDESSLEAVPKLKLQAQQDVDIIGNLTADNTLQQARMSALKSLAAQQIQFSESGIDLRRSQGLEPSLVRLRSGEGQKLMREFQGLIGLMSDEELRLLTIRNKYAIRRLRDTKIVLELCTALGLLIAISAGWTTQREHGARALALRALHESEERFRTLANNISQFCWMADETGYIFWYNDRWFEYSGTNLEEMQGWGWQKVHHPDHVQRVVDKIAKCFLSGEIWEDTFPLRGRDGIYRWFLSIAVPIRDAKGNVFRWFGSNTDITERKEAEEYLANKLDELKRSNDQRKIVEDQLFEEKERAQVTLDSIGDAVACTDRSGNISFFNLVAEKMTGWSRQQATGQPMAQVLKILDATTRETIPDPMELAVKQNRSMHLPPNCLLVRRDGFEIPIEDSAAPIRDRSGQPTGAVIVFRDVTVARALALKVIYAAQHDMLTGLPNRTFLSDRITQAIALAQRHQKKLGVLFLDLDGFKHINDSLGHPIGDKLLESVAKRLTDCVRGTDTVSRQGGDEFVVLLSEMQQPEDAAITARRMLQAVAKAHSIEGHDLHITTSIGVSAYPDDGLNAETLIKNADTAMYQAKEHGRQSYQFFKPAMNVRAVERQSIEESLRRALERHEFSLHYQPKVNLRTGEITGAEALLRWTHPTRGPVPPGKFISVAEDCGLILPIGHWVLYEACRQTRAWLEAGLTLGTMAVNISAMEFRDDNFLAGVFAILKETGLDPGSLELELTESVLMKRAECTESVLKTLRARGVQLAVDDFGTGYSSLSYLRKFPLDNLKIDQSFVRQITTSPDETTIVTAIISMGRSLKLRVVAEGVETPEELAFLQAHHCDEAQGYYFSRPVPAEEFARLLENGIPEHVLALRPQFAGARPVKLHS